MVRCERTVAPQWARYYTKFVVVAFLLPQAGKNAPRIIPHSAFRIQKGGFIIMLTNQNELFLSEY
ncbi:MAG: hypothetical protein K2O39_06650, partial [Clostridiales bacterium]|nr:hypothetical protein [Clostridiales bacterium]